jgi:hypothetical protein
VGEGFFAQAGDRLALVRGVVGSVPARARKHERINKLVSEVARGLPGGGLGMTDDEMTPMPETTDRKQDTRFKPGQSGNPAGRPKGSKHKIQEASMRSAGWPAMTQPPLFGLRATSCPGRKSSVLNACLPQ